MKFRGWLSRVLAYEESWPTANVTLYPRQNGAYLRVDTCANAIWITKASNSIKGVNAVLSDCQRTSGVTLARSGVIIARAYHSISNYPPNTSA